MSILSIQQNYELACCHEKKVEVFSFLTRLSINPREDIKNTISNAKLCLKCFMNYLNVLTHHQLIVITLGLM